MMEAPAPQSDVAPLGLRERNKVARRRRIEDAARSVFREKGFEAATTREIAARAGVGTGTLFVYARDKRQLLRMIYRDRLADLTATSVATVPQRASLLVQLLHIFRPRYVFWAEDPRLSRQAVRETFGARFAGDADAEPPSAQELLLHAEVVTLIARRQARGRVRAGVDPDLAARLIMDIYYYENRNWIAQREPDVDAGIADLRRLLELALVSLETS
jgi:AcrR family transcriptional regulator